MQELRQPSRNTARVPDANHVRRSLLARQDCVVNVGGERRDFFRQQRERLLNSFHTPRQDLLESGNRHRRQYKLRRLAHIEAARARTEGVGVVNQPEKIVPPSARDPRLFERGARLPPFWGDIEIAKSVRTKQPLISDRKSTRLNSSHLGISYAVFCLK